MVEQTGGPQAVATPDLNAVQEQTQPAALKLLDNARLGALLRDLRSMKAAAQDIALQKSLAQAIRRAAAERRARQGDASPKPDDTGARLAAKAASAASKAEEKARKEAERSERKRVKESERAEKKAAKADRKQAAGKLAQAKDKARDRKLARLGASKGPAKAGKVDAAKPVAEAGADVKPGPKPAREKTGKEKAGKDKLGKERPGKERPRKDKPGQDRAGKGGGKLRPDGSPRSSQAGGGPATAPGDDEASS